MSRVASIAGCLVAIICPSTFPAEEPEQLVSLLISKATAESVDKSVIVNCEATLDNATSRDLTVRSNFLSAFDGLEIVATNSEGKVLTQRGCTEHLGAVSLKGKDFPLKQGKTVRELRFILYDLPKGTRSLRVRMVGTLPGSSYQRILSSETIAVEIEKAAKK